MAKQKIEIKDFALGGLSDGKFSGVKNSVYKLVGFDLHSVPRLLQVRQKLTKNSGVTIDEFCKVILPCTDGNTYFFSSTSGKVWKRTSAGVYSLLDTTVNPSAIGNSIVLSAIEYKGFVYLILDNRIMRIASSNTANWTTQMDEAFAKLDATLEIVAATNVNNYTLPTSISESAADVYSFVATHKVITGIGVQKHTQGTGDWTVELHDSANNVLATKTIANASLALTDVSLYHFQFTTPVTNLTVGSTYHIHLKVSTGTSKVYSVTNASWAAGAANIYTSYSATDHPLIEQNQVLYIGDKNRLHQIDDGVFTRDALDLPDEHVIKCLGKINTDVLIGTYISSNISKGTIFQWNTWSVSWSNSDDIDEVGINAFLPADNRVLVHAGVAGNIYEWNGIMLKLWKRIEGSYSASAKVIVHPNATANIEGQTLMGLSFVTGDAVELGVYVLGHHDNKYPYIVDLSYPISERLSGALVLSNIEIGAVAVSGSDIFVAWQRSSTVTMTIASPVVVTRTAHGLSNGDGVKFSTTGALPTGITAGTVYYIRSVDANTFNLYDTSAHAISGGATGRVDTSGTQSGVHTMTGVGIDKTDTDNKLSGAYLETRAMVVDRFGLSTFSDFAVAYESLPTNTVITMSTKRNHATDYTALSVVTDTDRKIVKAENTESQEATVLQLKIATTASSNNAPTIEEAQIEVE